MDMHAKEIDRIEQLLVGEDIRQRQEGVEQVTPELVGALVPALLYAANTPKNSNELAIDSLQRFLHRRVSRMARILLAPLADVPRVVLNSWEHNYAHVLFASGRPRVIRAFIEQTITFNRGRGFRLDRARLRELPPMLAEYPTLTRLSLAECHFDEVPAVALRLRALEQLNLNDCGLRRFSAASCDFPRLTRLRLKGNKLRVLPDAIRSLTGLEILDLRGNPFSDKTRLSEQLAGLPNLRRLHLES